MNSNTLLNLAFMRSFGQTRDDIHNHQNQKKLIVSDEILTSIFSDQVVKNNDLTVDLDLNQLTQFTISYKDHFLNSFTKVITHRDCARFDFLEEWNNLGYGAIPLQKNTPFSIDHFLVVNSTQANCDNHWHCEVLAELIHKPTQQKISAYIVLFKSSTQQVLWINRPIANYDGFDWVIVENFFNDVAPVISEIPYEYNYAVTHRIDCDEAIHSGDPLIELYKKYNIPFSMAIKTEQNISHKDIATLKNLIESKGSVVTHSHTHRNNWGGSFEEAQFEVSKSHEILKSFDIPKINYNYAVSPFHKNPEYALKGIFSKGIKACVGGIICNDPEFITQRAGVVTDTDLVFHTQQCMLHGDTYHQNNNQLDLYYLAIELAFNTQTFLGYLDHPFSSYQYGWLNEEERLQVHENIINYINTKPKVWWASLENALNFLTLKSKIKVKKNHETQEWVIYTSISSHEKSFTEASIEENKTNNLNFKIKYKNQDLKYTLMTTQGLPL